MDGLENVVQTWKPAPDGHLALKPCPFCGNEKILYMQYKTPAGLRWLVVCCECMANIDPGWAQNRHRVAELWNRRAGKNE